VITITAIIRTGYDRGAQLVEVDKTMTAKIYNPSYYDEFNEFGIKQDVVQAAGGDYSREAVAYQKLQYYPTARAVTPAYLGTWPMEVETCVGKLGEQRAYKREVQLILIKRLHRECMSWVSPQYMRKAVRSLILKSALHAEAIVLQAGVVHCDFCPRNIVIIGSNYEAPDIAIKDIRVEVKVIDFNVAEVMHHPHYSNRSYSHPQSEDKWFPRLQSPIVRHHSRIE
jgi:hypothetical protein